MSGLTPRIPAVVVLAGVGVAGILLVTSSLKYPAIYRLPDAGAVVSGVVAAHLIINLCLRLIGGGLGPLIAHGARSAQAPA